jgi:hypothetical protein
MTFPASGKIKAKCSKAPKKIEQLLGGFNMF